MKERISAYIPKDLRWILGAIENVQQIGERNGIPLSQANVIVSILEEGLKNYKLKSKLSNRKVKKKSKKSVRTINIRQEFTGVVEIIDNLVRTKNDIGMKTSFSFELLRLAKNGLLREMVGANLDKRILEKLL